MLASSCPSTAATSTADSPEADVEARRGVTKIMNGDAFQTGRLGCLGEATVADVPVRHRATALAREDEAGRPLRPAA